MLQYVRLYRFDESEITAELLDKAKAARIKRLNNEMLDAIREKKV
ncbi:UNVERIFIED_ORG: hypothetical protein [Escherichia phage CMSTMSU]